MSISKQLRGLWWNTSFRRWMIASLLLYQAAIGFVSAEPDLTPAFTYQRFGACEWQPDNTLLITNTPNHFNDQGATRFVYHPQTEALTPQGGLPSGFSLFASSGPISPAVYKDDREPDPLVFNSPDGRFAIYSLGTSEDAYRSSLNILDRKTWQSAPILNFGINPHSTTIRWSPGSTSFLITAQPEYAGDPDIAYVDGFASDLGQMEVIWLSGFSGFNDAMQWTLYQAHDIDSTGQFILADGYIHEAEDRPDQLHLMIINMQDFTYELVEKDRFFITARFEQPGNQRVFYLNSAGLFAYDRYSKTGELLNDTVQDINKKYWRTCMPTISPDGRFIAFDDDDEATEVIVLPIKQP